jgi:predicted XRE-type DNA-binding protein
MGTNTSCSPSTPQNYPHVVTANASEHKITRIATMTKRLLDEVDSQPLDTASLQRLRTIDTQIIGELLTALTPDLRQELQRLALPLTRHTKLTDAEPRLAHAQLVGWLHGLVQTALSDPHALQVNHADTVQTATDTSTPSNIPTQPNQLDQPDFEPCSPTKRPSGAPNEDNPAIRLARHTLITAIIRRITQQRLTAAQTAAILHLTGPKATKLFHADIDEFTLNELVSFLPSLQLTLQVIPARQRHPEHSDHRERPDD